MRRAANLAAGRGRVRSPRGALRRRRGRLTVEDFTRTRVARLRAAWLGLVDWCIPPALRVDGARLRRIRTCVGYAYLASAFTLLFALFARLTFAGEFGRALFWFYLGGVPVVVLAVTLMRARGMFALPTNVVLGYFGLAFCFSAHYLGGPTATAMFWMMVLPTCALFALGPRAALGWTAAVFATYGAFLVAYESGYAFPLEGTPAQRARLWFNSGSTLMLFMLTAVLTFERARREAVHALEQANVELEAARDRADAANRSKTAFLSNMSHEIRTPMTALLGFTEVAADRVPAGELQPEERRALETIQRNGHHLLKIVNEMLDLSKIESGRFEIHASRFALVELVNEVVTLLRGQAEAKGNTLVVEYVAAVPEALETDPLRLQQVLINLVSNALKFSFRSEVRIRIQGVSHPDMDRVRFDVVDSGIGMTKAQAASVFEPFAQAESSTARRFGGSGLGLSISRILVELMGGTVSVASEPGVGSTFTVELPIGTREPVRMLASAEASGAMQGKRAKPVIRLNCRVLMVDDNADNRRLIGYFLRDAGADFHAVESGEDALAKWADLDPDVILMDIQMPRMDGYAATRLLREMGCRIPIVALTAHAMTTERERCLAAGFDGYGSKPIDRRRLLELVDRHARAGESSVALPDSAEPKPAPAPRKLPLWDRWAMQLLPPAQREQHTDVARARTILWLTIAPIPILPFEAAAMWYTMEEGVRAWAVGMVLFAIPLCLGVQAVLRFTGSTVAAANTLLAYSFGVIATCTYWRGGLPAPAAFWMQLIPMVAVSLVGGRYAIGWAGLCIANHAAFFLAHRAGLEFGKHVSLAHAGIDAFVSVSGLFVAVMLLMLAYERARSDALETLAALNRSLDDARQQAERANGAKSAFLANVSHELRTPMTAILGFADMLLADWDGRVGLDEARPLIGTVQRSGRQLLAMINDLLDFSKAESGRLAVESIPYSPEVVLSESVGLLRASAQAKGLELGLALESLPGMLHGDPLRLGQIAVKLLDNAIKFTERGRVDMRATLHGQGDDAWLELAVSDTGRGIPRDAFASLFTSFHQLDASATREHGGTGLGLALCQRLATALGGAIEVESELGRGTTFRVRLPARAAATPAPVAAPSHGRLSARILLAEDAPDSQRLLAQILERAGALVDVADHGAIALEKVHAAAAAQEPYDALVLDMQMPVLDGEATARELRAEGHTLPILALTAESSPEERERCLAAGCDDYATKPIDRARLIAKLHALLDQKS
jgi:signal transduction histidine kinase/DNA-binding response OmpR family regulator